MTADQARPRNQDRSSATIDEIEIDGDLIEKNMLRADPNVTKIIPMIHTRTVLHGISGLSVGGTDALTSAYGESSKSRGFSGRFGSRSASTFSLTALRFDSTPASASGSVGN